MRPIRKAAPWLLGVVFASVFFAVLWQTASFYYTGSDDSPILQAFMGYEGGVPATFHLYTHTVLAWLLWALAHAFPGVAWFSVLQVALLWLSAVLLVKSPAQLSRRHGLTVWPGALAGAVLLVGYTLFVVCRISYTTTCALCGAAAVAQLASVDFTAPRRRSVIGPLLGSAALLLATYSIRQVSVVPPLCFWLLTLAVKLLSAFGRARQPWVKAKPVFLGLLITALLFGGFAGVRAIDIRANHAEDFLAWQNERIRLFDYSDFDTTTTPQTLAKTGWSDTEFTMFTYWYFLDDNMTTAALSELNAQQTADDAGVTTASRLRAVWPLIQASFGKETAMRMGVWAALAMLLAALCAWALRRGRTVWEPLGLLAATLGGAALLVYLAYAGRLPMRAITSVLFPLAAFALCALFGLRDQPLLAPAPVEGAQAAGPGSTGEGTAALLAPDALTQAATLRHTPGNPPLPAKAASAPPKAIKLLCWLALGAALAMHLWFCAQALAANVKNLQPTYDVYGENAEEAGIVNRTDLESYALENPDTLIVYDLSLITDHRLFPDTSAGIPGNLMFWGGWPARSPSWYRMLAKYGVTERNPALFLRDNVRVASTDPEPSQTLMTLIAQYAGDNVDWEYDTSVGYVNIFRIYSY